MRKIVIIGGGVLSLLTAYYLAKAGLEITIVAENAIARDDASGDDGVGMPDHLIQLFMAETAATNSTRRVEACRQPFYIKSKECAGVGQWSFLSNNYTSGNLPDYSMQGLAHLSMRSKDLYLQLSETHLSADFGMEKKGLLMLFKTDAAAQHENEVAHRANMQGIKAQVLTRREVQLLEPHVRLNVVGGVLYPGDACPDPKMLKTFLGRYLRQKGVTILENTSVLNYVSSGKSIRSVQTSAGNVSCDHVIICAEACTGDVAGKLQLTLPAYKGVQFTADNLPSLSKSVMLVEEQVMVTPVGNKLHIGGAIKTNYLNKILGVCPGSRINTIVGRYFEHKKDAAAGIPLQLHGLRQSYSNGMACVGASAYFENVCFGKGYINLAPAIGEWLTDMVLKKIAVHPLSSATGGEGAGLF
ncbi:NAD(P)/FAD-dependent oxidoreductase [Botryobacter ruber]|uniref:NAD(P)/FAD-dependent oxidoreductase n=1 Tax=Botryobacter ruber TaxID=2171629 RepID=UPI000E0C2DCD|nr:FAD-dependent oxidoreductase [Botryobacter ruber]